MVHLQNGTLAHALVDIMDDIPTLIYIFILLYILLFILTRKGGKRR